MHRWMWLGLLVVVGCKEEEKTETEDSAADTAEDTAEDTGDTAVEDPVIPNDQTLTFFVDGDPSGLAVALTPVSLVSNDVSSDVWYAASAGVSIDVTPGGPPSSFLEEIDPANAPELMGVAFIPTLVEQSDSDPLPNASESFRGLGTYWLLFLDGPIPLAYSSLGLAQGWNVVNFHDEVLTSASLLPITEIPMPAAMPRADRLELEGGLSTSAARPRLALVTESEQLLDDVALSGDTWAYTYDGAPPESHFISLDDPLGEGAVEFGVLYNDADASGSPSDGDAQLGQLCSGDLPVAAIYLPMLSSTEAILVASELGLSNLGWAFVLDTGDGDFRFLAVEAGVSLNLRDGCGL